MKRCIMLLPTFYNDGREVPLAVMDDILDQIYEGFGGYTVAGLGYGPYRMKGGRKARDLSLEIWVAVDASRVEELKKLAAKFARILGQEAIYFEVMDSEVEFIGPDPED